MKKNSDTFCIYCEKGGGILEFKKRCESCEYAREINATGDWRFIGCRHEPYKGKWVAEIKDCPKEKGDSNS